MQKSFKNRQQIQKKLEELREQWKQNPSKRDIIEVQGKALKRALEVYDQLV